MQGPRGRSELSGISEEAPLEGEQEERRPER